MPEYFSKDRVTRGVPLGGMGAGKFEIFPTGEFGAFTFLNNWSKPLGTGGQGLLGFHLAVATDQKKYLLQTSSIQAIPCVPSILYRGNVAQSTLDYQTPGLGAKVSLEASSPWIPGDAKNSSLPVVFFDLMVKNTTSQLQDISLLFVMRNLCGDWCVGRQNRVKDNELFLDVLMDNPFSAGWDLRRGQMLCRFEKKGWETSSVESWNAVTKNFSFKPEDIFVAAWEPFVKQGQLPNTRSTEPQAEGENREFCSAVCAKTRLNPEQKKVWRFTLAWDFPDPRMPHAYSRYFKSAHKSTDYAVKHGTRLKKRSELFRGLVHELPFPKRFNEALLTSLTPFQAATRHLADGRFAFYEAPEVCPLLGTLDVGFYGSIPLAYFFPKLESAQILQFSKFQRTDGYIPHDLGRGRMDQPSNGTTFFKWKDLNPKFVLMAYRDYLWAGKDKRFLNTLFPHVKKAIAWTWSQDHDGDGLPDHEGADQTFDLWTFKGPGAYTGSLFMAALLAGEKMANLVGDEAFSRECREGYLHGRDTLENKIWNGRFFGKEFSAISQLNGQWYADLLDLGAILDPVKMKKAIGFVLSHHGKYSPHGLVNSVLPDGREDHSNEHAKNVWAGMNYALLSTALARGFALNNLLKEADRLWHNAVWVQKSPWSQPDTVDAKTGRYLFGDFYYRNMAIWSIPITHAKKDKKTAMLLKQIKTLSEK